MMTLPRLWRRRCCWCRAIPPSTIIWATLWRAGRHIDARFQWNHAITFSDSDTDKAAIERKLKTGLSEKPA